METALASLLLATVMLFGVLTISNSYFNAQEALALATTQRQERVAERARTNLAISDSTVKSSGAILEVVVRNEGDVQLADFDEWDVFVHYWSPSDELSIYRLTFAPASATNREWTVVGIYADAASYIPEPIGPNVLNPGEELLIQLKLLPPIGPDTVNYVVLSSPNGVTAEGMFIR